MPVMLAPRLLSLFSVLPTAGGLKICQSFMVSNSDCSYSIIYFRPTSNHDLWKAKKPKIVGHYASKQRTVETIPIITTRVCLI